MLRSIRVGRAGGRSQSNGRFRHSDQCPTERLQSSTGLMNANKAALETLNSLLLDNLMGDSLAANAKAYFVGPGSVSLPRVIESR